jgi:hypothetical protein
MCNAVQTCHGFIKGSCWLLEQTLKFNVLRGLEWTLYQFYTIPIAMCGRLLKFLRNG